MELDEHAVSGPNEPADDVLTHNVQRRETCPRRCVQDGRASGIHPTGFEDAVAAETAIDETIALRHPDQPNGRSSAVDRPACEEISQSPPIDEEESIPMPH